MFLVIPCWPVKTEDAQMGPSFTEYTDPCENAERRQAGAKDRTGSVRQD